MPHNLLHVPDRLVVFRTGEVLADNVIWARTHRERARGLLGKRPLRGAEAMIFENARQVHTFGMTYPIDVIFCDCDWKVLHVARSMSRARVTRWVWRARYAIELRADSVPSDLTRGEVLALRP